MTSDSIAVKFMMPALAELVERVGDISAILTLSGENWTYQDFVEGRIEWLAIEDFMQIYARAVNMLEQVVSHISFDTCREVAFVPFVKYMHAASTLREAIENAIDFSRAMDERGYRFGLTCSGATARLTMDLDSTVDEAPVSSLVGTMVAFYNVLCWLTDKQLKVLQVAVPDGSGCNNPWLEMLGAQIVIGERPASITLPVDELSSPIMRDFKDIQGKVQALMYDPLFFTRLRRTIPDAVRALIEGAIRSGAAVPSSSDVADRLGISTATLVRRLREDHTSFSEIRTSVLLAESRRLLRNGNGSIRFISSRMGFSEVRSFRRFFLKAGGALPSTFRKSGS